MAGETTVGSIKAYLRLDTSDWNQAILAAQAQAEALGNTDPNVTVGVNSAAAIAELQAIHAAADHLNDSFDDLSSSSVSSGHQMTSTWKKVLMAVAPILPAMVPLGAAAVGVGAAMGAAGATGALAFMGVKDAMAQGTAMGQRFSAGLDVMKDDLHVLEGVAAAGVLDPFEASVRNLNQHMPGLTLLVDDVSNALGQTLASGLDGVLTLLVKMSPAIDLVMQGVQHVAGAFDAWAHSAGASDLVTYMVNNLPTAGQLLSNLANIVGDLVQAFAPIGSTVLSILSTLTGLIDDIPVGVLSTFASVVTGVGTAFLLWRGLRGLISGVAGSLAGLSTHMSGMNGLAASAASATSRLSMALGGVLGVVGAGVAVWSLWKASQRKAEQQQRELTDAIREDNGVIGENTEKALARVIAQKHLIDKSKELGISTQQMTAALKDEPGAWKSINRELMKNHSHMESATKASAEMGKSTRRLDANASQYVGTLKQTRDGLAEGQKEWKRHIAAAKALADKTKQLSQHQRDLRNATISASDATDKQRRAINKLNNEIDQQISLQLRLSGSLTGYASARNQLIHTLRKNASTTRLNTKRGIENRQQIENTVGALQTYRQKQIDAGRSTRMATLEYRHNGKQLLDQIAKTDGASSATYKYTKKLLAIPDDVKTRIGIPGFDAANRKVRKQNHDTRSIPTAWGTTFHADTGGAEAAIRQLKWHIATIHGKTVYIRVRHLGGRVKGGPGRNISPNYADGGIVGRAYADGGIESHIAQIATHGPRIWAEPETGGEAYIPLASSKRPRSMQILKEVADRFDMTVAPQAAQAAAPTVVTSGLSRADIEALGDYIGQRVFEGAWGGTAQRDADRAVGARIARRGVAGSGIVPA